MAIEMVDFMLENTGQEAFRFIDDGLAVTCQRTDLDFGSPFHFAVISGDAQAAFGIDIGFVRFFQDLRIDELDEAVAVVEDDELQRFIDLRRS